LAFVFEDEVSIQSTQTQQDIGIAEKFARFEVVGERVVGEVNYVEAVVGLVPASAVRIAKKVRRPPEIPAGAQWIHVDLGEQVLIAYEGDTPLRATLVSSGKPGYEPPLGVFRVHKKYVSKTMAGEDDVEGTYEVAQVPWILYYWGSFALHGAYWHDDFGTVRSHGCTNIPPYDAHWLFHWARPKLPRGWHGAVGVDGPWIYTSA
jgi:lipoprotein-anchoring transpeptidase ErfK/SrfK